MTLLISACTSAPEKNLEQIIEDAVTQPENMGDSALDVSSAEFYIRAATENQGTESRQYLIKAAEILYAKGGFTSADDTAISQESSQARINHSIRIRLLAAKIALVSKMPLAAIDLLPQKQNLTLSQLSESNAIRAQALLKIGHFVEAIRTQIESERLTQDADKKETINHSIWTILSSLPTITIESETDVDQTLQGWFDLSLIMRNAQSDITLLQENILDWGTQYPLHPVSNTFIEQLLNDYVADFSKFDNIAIFLPSAGKYQFAAEVVSNGFLSAYYEHSKDAIRPNIRFYDTSRENINFDALYEQAVKEGADIIIGPIEKEIINTIVDKNDFIVPVLTLNYSDETVNTADNLFQFGLLPEDEADQVAELAIQQNKRNAAVLVPDSDWGKRLANAFTNHFESLGGEVLSQQLYSENVDDFSKPIRLLFNLDESNERYRRLKQLLQTDLEFTPQRRQDIDMVFVAATHRAARSIVPALKFHHASDIQAYATSHVYTGHIDSSADRDLNGLMFCDIPWTITSKNKLKTTFTENWKNQDDYTRLYALGVDAFALMHNLKYLKKHEGAYFSGETGNIIIGSNNRLHRSLVWAKFTRGKPVYIDPTKYIPDDQNEINNPE